MASRRAKLKGIINIPQRRKSKAVNEEPAVVQANHEKSTENVENYNPTFSNEKLSEETELHLQPDSCTPDEKSTSNISQDNFKACNGDISQPTENCSANMTACSAPKIEEAENTNVPHIQQSKPILRRKFIKPVVSASVINRKSKQRADIENADKKLNLPSEEGEARDEGIKKENMQKEGTTIEETVISPTNILNLDKTPKLNDEKEQYVSNTTFSLQTENEVTLDETCLAPQNDITSRPDVPLDNGIKKLTPYSSNSQNCDNEYPPPPPSPSKINRSRIKAIPRLSYRKTSFSASESEDESKRIYNRNRNDSVCSTASGVTESVTECMSPQRPKEFSSIIQKKCNRTEQSRKLAEARREFHRRFGNNKPDRQKLTMIDLIFYNPTSNPMKDDGKTKHVSIQDNADVHMDNENEEIDDPDEENEDAGKSDEENEMPVPQIKIGPSGEIILDEKSLVIENKEVKKQREEMKKSQPVNGDFDTSYGIYKRQKRSKNWTQNETLRFYKALNTIGTDFTLMCELFPRRTRRELKMKFKREEKINRELINKAVMQPCNFNFTELQQEVHREEREFEELQKQKEDEANLKKKKSEEKPPKKRKTGKEEVAEETTVKTGEPKPTKPRKVRKPKIKKSIESVLENSDADESDIASQQDESDEEVSMPLRPTRSGRVPKVARKFDHTESMSIDHIMKTNKVSDVKTDSIEPGSIMIITEKGPNSEPIYKIYMVTPDQNATPLNLTSDVVSKAIELKKGYTAQNIVTISANLTDDELENTLPEENNITIPADDNRTIIEENNTVAQHNTLVENNITIPAENNEH